MQSSGRRLCRFCISVERNVEKKLSSRRARRRCYALRDERKSTCSFISVVIQCGFKARTTFANLTRRGTSLDEKWSRVAPPCFEPFSTGQLALGLHLDSGRYFSEFGSVASGLATARLPALWLARPCAASARAGPCRYTFGPSCKHACRSPTGQETPTNKTETNQENKKHNSQVAAKPPRQGTQAPRREDDQAAKASRRHRFQHDRQK